jgi:plastocyanin
VASARAAAVLGLLLAATAVAADHAVSISGFEYDPSSITIEVGDTVTWTNSDGTDHTVTADDASFDSGTVADGATFAWTFASAGTVTYHCAIHPTMTGTVDVQAAPATPPPTPTLPTPAGPAPTPPSTSTSAARTGAPGADNPFAILVALAILAGLLVFARQAAPFKSPPR